MRVLRKVLLLLLLSFFSLFSFSQLSHASSHQIEDQQLKRLEEIFNQQQLINERTQDRLNRVEKNLSQSKKELEIFERKLILASKELEESKDSLIATQMRLEESEKISKDQEILLQKVNKSFEKYSQEQRKKINSLKLQRGILVTTLIMSMIIAMK